MVDEEFDSWQTGSGLLTDYEGTVIKAEFAIDVNYQQGIPYLLFLTLEYVDKDSGETFENVERYSVGSDWKSYDGGETVEHPKGATQRINKNGQYGRLIDAAIEAGGADLLRKRGKATNAGVWVGTQWHFAEVSTDYNIDGNKITSNKNFPDKYLGVVEDGGSGKAEELTTESIQGVGPSSNGSGVLDDVDPALVLQMTGLAREHDYSSWVDQVMGLTGVAESDTLIVALADDKLYTQLKG